MTKESYFEFIKRDLNLATFENLTKIVAEQNDVILARIENFSIDFVIFVFQDNNNKGEFYVIVNLQNNGSSL